MVKDKLNSRFKIPTVFQGLNTINKGKKMHFLVN